MKKRIRSILTILLSLSGALPAAAMDYETANDLPPVFLPLAPTNLVAEPGDGAVTLRWDYPHNASDDWQYRQNAGGWQDMPDADEYRVTGLTNGATYTFEVRAHNTSGWGPASNTATVTLNAAPIITGLERAFFAENSQGPVTTYLARDAEGDPITWSLSGRDAGAFTFTIDVERNTMDLLFQLVPDYEHPSDVSPTDNDYQVTLVASDHGLPALSTNYLVTVKVVNVDDAGSMPVMVEPERSRDTTQAEYVGRVMRAVFRYYKGIIAWVLRGVVNHVRDVFGAGKRTQRDADALAQAEVPDAPKVSVASRRYSATVWS